MFEAEKWYTEGESDKVFAALFPNGFTGEDVLGNRSGRMVAIDAAVCSDKPDGARSLQVEKMKTELKKTHRDAIDDAKHDPIPTIVLAYENVYGHLPHGWPPWKFQDRSE